MVHSCNGRRREMTGTICTTSECEISFWSGLARLATDSVRCVDRPTSLRVAASSGQLSDRIPLRWPAYSSIATVRPPGDVVWRLQVQQEATRHNQILTVK